MARLKLLLKYRIYVLLTLFLIPSFALAVLVYDWQEEGNTDFPVTGTMKFSDDVAFGDIVDPLSEKLLEFSFSNVSLSDWRMSDFVYGHFLRPEASGVDLDPSGLAIPGSGKKQGAVKKVATKDRVFNFERDDAFLYFTVSSGAKKKAAVKRIPGSGSSPSSEPYPPWSWTSFAPVDCPVGTTCKKAARVPSGEGYWVLKSGAVAVPEPTMFLLTLAGLGVIISLYKRSRRRV